MPQSKKRPHAHPQQHLAPNNKTGVKKNNKLTAIAIIFFGLIGLGMSFFMADGNIIWMIIGAILGTAAGYIFANEMMKTFSKNK